MSGTSVNAPYTNDRSELLQRLELMETMVSEGRRLTTRNGWIFLLWGVLYFVATGWTFFLPHKDLAWPVCIMIGVALSVSGRIRLKHKYPTESLHARSIGAVWKCMGAACVLYFMAYALSHRPIHGAEYVAPYMFFLGIAHGASAIIVRWKLQGAVAALWAAGAVSMFFVNGTGAVTVFLAVSFFGMIVFGLYTMAQERKHA